MRITKYVAIIFSEEPLCGVQAYIPLNRLFYPILLPNFAEILWYKSFLLKCF